MTMRSQCVADSLPVTIPLGPRYTVARIGTPEDTGSRIDIVSCIRYLWSWLMVTVATWKFDCTQNQHLRLSIRRSSDLLSVAAVGVPDHGIGKDPNRFVCRARHLKSLTTSRRRLPRANNSYTYSMPPILVRFYQSRDDDRPRRFGAARANRCFT
jgi:hypothetical protein